MSSSSLTEEVLSIFLQEGTLDYFDLTSCDFGSSQGIIYLREKKIIPEDLNPAEVYSNGFFPEATLQDFPIRGRKMFLKILRRRWCYKNGGGSFSRNWEFLSRGMRISKEFASFLKELPG